MFTPELAAVGVTNIDDPYGRLLLDAATIPTPPYSTFDAADIEVTILGHRFVWRGRYVAPIGGAFNVMNSLAALTALDALWASTKTRRPAVLSAGRRPAVSR